MNDFLKQFWNNVRLLPLLVLVAGLAFIVRVGEATMEVKSLTGAAFAATETTDTKTKEAEATDTVKADSKTEAKDAPKDAPKDETKADSKSEGAKTDTADAKKEDAPQKLEDVKSKTEWKDAGDTDIEYSEVRDDLYKDLLARRQELDAREKELQKREALVTATRDEIKSKVQELTSLKTEIQSLLKKQTDEEQANVTRLVRIYEGMKPKDAARIFNALDMDVLIAVVSKMSEKKSALILAAMEAEKARSLTMMLSEQKKLPDLKMEPVDSAEDSPPPLPSLGQERDQTGAVDGAIGAEPPPAPAPAPAAPPA